MKEILAKDSERIVVFDKDMKHSAFLPFAIRACSVVFLLFLTAASLCLIPDAFYNWIDHRGPIIGTIVVLLAALLFGFRWLVIKLKQ